MPPNSPRASAGARLAALVLAIGCLTAACTGSRADTPPSGPSPSRTSNRPTAGSGGSAPALPGLNVGPAPWPPERAHLAERLRLIHLPELGPERVDVHFHVNLVVSVRGRGVHVPVGIGIRRGGLAEIHTHTGSGTIHIEGSKQRRYTLGMVFDVWGVRFTADCVGGYCTGGTDRLRVFLDGQPYAGDPTKLRLANEQVIVVAYGTDEQLPDPMPARFVYEGKPKPA